jgi:hypothetical protein
MGILQPAVGRDVARPPGDANRWEADEYDQEKVTSDQVQITKKPLGNCVAKGFFCYQRLFAFNRFMPIEEMARRCE